MKKILRVFIIVVVIAVFGGTLYYLYDKSKEKPEVFETEKPFVTDIEKKTVATGSVVPRFEIEIKPQVSGIIQEIYVEAGEQITEGQLMAKVKIIPNMVSLNEAESRVEKAKIQLKKSDDDLRRQKKLFDQEVIPASTFLQYEVSFESAKEDLNAAENNLRLIKEGVRKESDKASNTLIRSTITGMVLDVPVEVGNSVIESNTFNPGTTIATVANMNEMIFEGKVDETEVGKIHEGMPLKLTIGAIDNYTFDANLEYISPKGLEENGAIQFEIKAAMQLNDSVFVRAGYSANADIVLEHVEDVMAVKESLLQFEEEKAYVDVRKEDGTFERKDVVLGLSDGINIEVKEGLSGEEEIKVIK